MASSDVIRSLRQYLPATSVIADGVGMRPFETDGLTAYKKTPMVVALPESVAQVRAVLEVARKHGVPVVTRGAGTGLSGGALPHAEGILLVVSKMKRVLEIDLETCTARVEPGVTNLGISNAVSRHSTLR